MSFANAPTLVATYNDQGFEAFGARDQDSVIYGITNQGNLMRINPTTGARTNIAALGSNNNGQGLTYHNNQWICLVYRNDRNRFEIADLNISNARLSNFRALTNTTVIDSISGIFSHNNTLYITGSNNIGTINVSTGAVTLLGLVGATPGGFSSAYFNYNNLWYTANANSSAAGGHDESRGLYSFSLNTFTTISRGRKLFTGTRVNPDITNFGISDWDAATFISAAAAVYKETVFINFYTATDFRLYKYDLTVPPLGTYAEPTGVQTSQFVVPITFREAVSGVAQGDFSITGASGATHTITNASTTLTNVNVTPPSNSNGNLKVNLAADSVVITSSGETGPDEILSSDDITFDTRPITITFAPPANSMDNPIHTATADVTITFSQAVATLTRNEVTSSLGRITNVTGSGTTYTATVQFPANTNSNLTLSISANAVGRATAPTDTWPKAIVTSDPIYFNTQAVTISFVPPANTSANRIRTDTADIAITFSESVTGLQQNEVTSSLGSITNLVGSGRSYTATVTFPEDSTGSLTISIAANAVARSNDAASTWPKAITTSAAIFFDTRGLSATFSPITGTQTQDYTVVVTFSEPVSGVTRSDFSVTGRPGATHSIRNVSSTVTNVLITPPENDAGTLSLNVLADSVVIVSTGETGPDTIITSPSVGFNTRSDVVINITPTINSVTNPLRGNTTNVSIVFSEDVVNFTQADLSVSKGRITAFVGSGRMYTATITFPVNTVDNLILSIRRGAAGRRSDPTDTWPKNIQSSGNIYFDTTPAPVDRGTATDIIQSRSGPVLTWDFRDISGTTPAATSIRLQITPPQVIPAEATEATWNVTLPRALETGETFTADTLKLEGVTNGVIEEPVLVSGLNYTVRTTFDASMTTGDRLVTLEGKDN